VVSQYAQPQATAVPRRVVLLGASNLTRGISTVLETAENVWGRPLEVLGALGHGRSYGLESNFLGRKLPGIIHCGLWDALEQRKDVRTAALVTDIGNDILYEAPVPLIVSWVQTAIERLQEKGATICMTLPPLESAKSLNARRFLFFRKLFFPRCTLGLSEVVDRAVELHDRLSQLAESHRVALVAQRGEWYSIDPIHIVLKHWRGAWFEVLSQWDAERAMSADRARGSLRRWLFLRTRAPHFRRIFGLEMRQKQPSACFRYGTSVAFY
jgi:hypothetical protein